ncbi:MAG: hypothetical protein M1828_001113 [Chrysothrix sp. TS-e1954]|nr:MAG: hypothetical protein M1828_001113 [Chrysothrix sp. TS-e1954]
MKGKFAKEFPYLQDVGLYASLTSGDGNCLFNALSDQLYGNEEHHVQLRQATIEYLRSHKDEYLGFIDVNSGNATRRQPKRKTAGAYATKIDATMPDADQINAAFESYINEMSRKGVWGGNMELVAFARVMHVNIFVYQHDRRYMIAGDDSKADVHIAYHEWQHYSSIRNISGPHSGPPELQVASDASGNLLPTASGSSAPAAPTASTNFNESEIKMVQNSINPPVSREVAFNALSEHHGDVNNTVDYLIQLQAAGSTSSSQTASVVEGSESSAGMQKKKKQNRRISRATKAINREKKRQEIANKLEHASSDSLDSLVKISPNRLAYRKARIIEDSDDDWAPPPLRDSDTSSSSEYSGAAAGATKIVLKLSKPTEASPKVATKAPTNTKRLTSARDRKDMKKLVRKQDAKDRKAAAQSSQASSFTSNTYDSQHESPPMAKSPSQPGMTNGIQTLHI